MMISSDILIGLISALFGSFAVLSKYIKYLLEKQLQEKQDIIDKLENKVEELQGKFDSINEKFIELSKLNIEKNAEIKCVLEKCEKK